MNNPGLVVMDSYLTESLSRVVLIAVVGFLPWTAEKWDATSLQG